MGEEFPVWDEAVLYACPDYWGFFMAGKAHEVYMGEALQMAEKARGKTSPNPLVGAVIVRNGNIVGKGFHKAAGTPHAEIHAIRNAREEANGADLYVTLEPCCHYGRTGPCTDEIIKAGIKRVYYSLTDPNPKVKGKGAAALRRAGIEAVPGLLRGEAERQNEVYLKFIKTGRPFVCLKLAQSLDGCIAASNGESQWISSEASRKMVHLLRSQYDAVAVGAKTANIDNPSLTVRSVRGKNPYRIIISASLNVRKNLDLFRKNDDHKTILAAPKKNIDRFKIKNLTTWGIRSKGNGLSLEDFLNRAGQFGITSILVEGGAGLAASFIRAGLVDKFIFFVAPKLIGGGISSIADLGVGHPSEAIALKDMNWKESGKDLMVTAYPG